MGIVRCCLFLLVACVIVSDGLRCHECSCNQADLSACNCDRTSDLSDDSYCAIFEQRYTQGTTTIELSRIGRNSTYIYIPDPYFILVQESIRYRNASKDWELYTRGVVFGCDWDLCNSPTLVARLPDSFRLSINTSWLDTNILGTGTVSGCHQCSSEVCGNITTPIDITQCPMAPCINATTVRRISARPRLYRSFLVLGFRSVEQH